jgi:hypothetical protein
MHVYAINEERLTIALTDHLKECEGDGSEPRRAEQST